MCPLRLALTSDEAEAESAKMLGTEPADWLARALALALALARPVAHRPPSPLSSLGQFVALLRSEAVSALLAKGVLLVDCVDTKDPVVVDVAVAEAEREAETVVLADAHEVLLALVVTLSVPLLLLVVEAVLCWVALALEVIVEEKVLSKLLVAPDDTLPVAKAVTLLESDLRPEKECVGLVDVVPLSMPLLLRVLLALGGGELLGTDEADAKFGTLIAPAGLELAVVLSLKLTLLRVVTETDARREGEVERLGVADIKAVIVPRALPVREALTQPVKLGVAEALAVPEAVVVSEAEAEEQGEEEGEARRVRD